MWEIAARDIPYREEDRGPFGRFLKNRIKNGLRPDISALRPELYNTVYVAVMQQSWSEIPANRPTFADICEMLHPLSDMTDIITASSIGLLTM